MKVLMTGIFILFSVTGFSQNSPLGNMSPEIFTKYRIPTIEVRNISLPFIMNGYSQSAINKDSYRNPFNDFENEQNSNSHHFGFSPNFTLLKQSETTDLILSGSLNISSSYNVEESENLNTSNYYKNVDNHFRFNPYITAQYKSYNFSDSELFLNHGISTAYFYETTANQSNNLNSRSRQIRIDRVFSNTMLFGVGFGRLRNLTSVISAIRFQERLKDQSIINQDLSETTLLNLAQQFSNNGYYSGVFNRPLKYFWNDVDPILTSEVPKLNQMSSYSRFSSMEALNEVRFERFEGYSLTFNLKSKYNIQIFSIDNFVLKSLNQVNENHFFLLNSQFFYSHQLSMDSQISFGFSAEAGPNLSKLSSFNQTYDFSANGEFDIELTDKWVSQTSLEFYYDRMNFKPGREDENTMIRLTENLTYFIEDQLSLNGNISFVKNLYENNTENIPNSSLLYEKDDQTNLNYFISLTYYFDRSLKSDYSTAPKF